jgi:hypothetical protein
MIYKETNYGTNPDVNIYREVVRPIYQHIVKPGDVTIWICHVKQMNIRTATNRLSFSVKHFEGYCVDFYCPMILYIEVKREVEAKLKI